MELLLSTRQVSQSCAFTESRFLLEERFLSILTQPQ